MVSGERNYLQRLGTCFGGKITELLPLISVKLIVYAKIPLIVTSAVKWGVCALLKLN